ncbi:MAG: hypothetical protein MI748_17155 [Opitutales bacterium]|nr:hypothetical protein [Opitutales bacterium]
MMVEVKMEATQGGYRKWWVETHFCGINAATFHFDSITLGRSDLQLWQRLFCKQGLNAHGSQNRLAKRCKSLPPSTFTNLR